MSFVSQPHRSRALKRSRRAHPHAISNRVSAIAVSSHQAKVRSRGRNPRAAGSSHWNHAAARSGLACAYTGAVAVLFVLDVRNRDTADAVLEVQRAAYASEAALIGVDELPPLRETREDIVGSREQFLGASLDGALVGVISWECRDVACELSDGSSCTRARHDGASAGRFFARPLRETAGSRCSWRPRRRIRLPSPSTGQRPSWLFAAGLRARNRRYGSRAWFAARSGRSHFALRQTARTPGIAGGVGASSAGSSAVALSVTTGILSSQ